MKKFIAAACLVTLSACAGPVTAPPTGDNAAVGREIQEEKNMVYKTVIRDRDRVYNVSWPILAANAEFCKKTEPDIGATVWSTDTVAEGYKRAARAVYNLQKRLAVQFVADKSPADRAGIRSGDFVVAVNGQNIPEGREGIELITALMEKNGYDPAEILLERKNQLIRATVQPVEICAYPVAVNSGSNNINAFTDGKVIVVEKGILRFAENDNELALVIAHELGHIAMGHISKQQGNSMLGALGGLVADVALGAAGVNSGGNMTRMGQALGGMAYSVAFEQEADYVGMYFMERAGYNSARVADFWRRMGAEDPKSVTARTSHPTSPERFIAIERTHNEIISKKSRGQKILPNMKEDR